MGNLIRIRRESAGFQTQRSLAREIGKDPSWVSRLESGAAKEMPTPGDLDLICKAIGATQTEMLAAAGYDVSTGGEGDSPAITALRAILGNRDYTEEDIGFLSEAVSLVLNARIRGR